jgi:DNA (cytosine-5)-methyltransferase 1
MVDQSGSLRELALFAGAGGGILGGKLLGWRTVCAVEREAYAAAILAQRQNDGLLPVFPIWSDVTTFDGMPWRGIVNVVSGGFPCQDISAAGKGAGIEGERSGLWSEFARIICEVRPQFVFVENSPILTKRGLGKVLGDLATMGYDAEWCVLSASDCGAPHERKRIWIVAADNRQERVQGQFKGQVCGIGGFSWCENVRGPEDLRNRPDIPKPLFRRNSDGLAHAVDRISAIGNGQVPIVAATAWNILINRLNS